MRVMISGTPFNPPNNSPRILTPWTFSVSDKAIIPWGNVKDVTTLETAILGGTIFFEVGFMRAHSYANTHGNHAHVLLLSVLARVLSACSAVAILSLFSAPDTINTSASALDTNAESLQRLSSACCSGYVCAVSQYDQHLPWAGDSKYGGRQIVRSAEAGSVLAP
jgi:hypothetical protein